MASKSVATKGTTDVAAYNYDAHEGSGYENQTQDDISIPFLNLLQDTSPQVKKDGLEGAEVGMYHNSVTDELFEVVNIVASTTEHLYTEWVPRIKGGGFVGRHTLDSPVVAVAKEASTEFGKYKTPEGNDLVETFYVYGILCQEDSLSPVVVPFASTKISVYRKWNSKINMFQLPTADGTRKMQPPIFAHLSTLGSEDKTNVHGTFSVPTFQPANGEIKASLLAPDDPRFIAAEKLCRQFASGQARAAEETQSAGGTSDPFPTGDDEAPF